MEKLKLTMREIAESAGESLPTIYKAIEAGHLATFLVGRRRFAKPDAVRAWIDRLEKASNAGRPMVYRPRSGERAHGGA